MAMGMMGKGKPPMGGGNPMAGMDEELFGAGKAGPAGDIGDADIDAMFGGEEMEANPQDKLYEGLSMAGYTPTPEQVQQIMDILEGGQGGMAPEGITPTDTGMEAAPMM